MPPKKKNATTAGATRTAAAASTATTASPTAEERIRELECKVDALEEEKSAAESAKDRAEDAREQARDELAAYKRGVSELCDRLFDLRRDCTACRNIPERGIGRCEACVAMGKVIEAAEEM